ncbi:hypothetical protein ACEWY4_003451 [Coilia grayii]|uniref:Transposase Helix-turn-helix domain-containing protein n=1 Tax=Coilia grayii TaxID=363190 RepID=A0ABD1KRA6_9TELE
MTLMKLQLNFLQDGTAESFRVSQSVISRIISWWLDPMEEKMSDEGRRMWLKALNLKKPPKKPYVCSFHFVDGRPSEQHPYPEKWLGYPTPPPKKPRRILVRLPVTPPTRSTSQMTDDVIKGITHRDASTQWENLHMNDHTYARDPLHCSHFHDKATQCPEQHPDGTAESFRVSQSVISRIIAWWLDPMEEKMRCFVSIAAQGDIPGNNATVLQ